MAASMLRVSPLSVQTFLVISVFEKLPAVLWKYEQALTCPMQFHFGRLSLLTTSLLFFACLRKIMVSYKTKCAHWGWGNILSKANAVHAGGKTRGFLIQLLKLSPLSGAADHQYLKHQPTMSSMLNRKHVNMSNFISQSLAQQFSAIQFEGPTCIPTAMSRQGDENGPHDHLWTLILLEKGLLAAG